jgi:hypothetical protein
MNIQRCRWTWGNSYQNRQNWWEVLTVCESRSRSRGGAEKITRLIGVEGRVRRELEKRRDGGPIRGSPPSEKAPWGGGVLPSSADRLVGGGRLPSALVDSGTRNERPATEDWPGIFCCFCILLPFVQYSPPLRDFSRLDVDFRHFMCLILIHPSDAAISFPLFFSCKALVWTLCETKQAQFSPWSWTIWLNSTKNYYYYLVLLCVWTKSMHHEFHWAGLTWFCSFHFWADGMRFTTCSKVTEMYNNLTSMLPSVRIAVENPVNVANVVKVTRKRTVPLRWYF